MKNFIAGEELKEGAMIYLKSDGKVYMVRCESCLEPLKTCRCEEYKQNEQLT